MPSAHNRGAGVNLPAPNVGIPPRPFLWTPDQIATMLNLETKQVMRNYLYFEGRSIGTRGKDLMVAINIAPAEEKPEWRISEREFTRWMRYKGFRYYERGVFQ